MVHYRDQLKCDGTRVKTRFRLLAKGTSPFKSAGASVQSNAGSRGVRISGSNAGYTMFRGRVKSTGYPFHSPVFPSLPLPCVTVCHHISTGVYRGAGKFLSRPWKETSYNDQDLQYNTNTYGVQTTGIFSCCLYVISLGMVSILLSTNNCNYITFT